MQGQSRRFSKTALPKTIDFTVFLTILVQSSSFYYEIRDFYKIRLYICVFMKNIRIREKNCTFALSRFCIGGYMVSNEELKQKYSMFTDCWRFYKKYADVQEDDSYWEAVVNESSAIAKQYGECKLIIDLVLAVITEFERVYKEMRKNAET